jgi:hypothetical protein
MTTFKPASWTETEDWRELVKPEHHADFLAAIAEAARDGQTVKSVLVSGGTPIVYNLSNDE